MTMEKLWPGEIPAKIISEDDDDRFRYQPAGAGSCAAGPKPIPRLGAVTFETELY